jgi:ferredoxin-NADP reductase
VPAEDAGLLRKWLAPLVEPETFDFWAQRIHPTWSWSRPLARVVERREEAADAVTLVLAANRHCQMPRPGQHLNVSAEVNGRRTTRSYSITNVPGDDRRLAITVKRVEGGTLSTHLVRHARVGDVVTLGAPFGDMTWPLQPAQVAPQWLFLAAGSGITPLVSLVRDWAARRQATPLTLVYWVKTYAEACFVNELRELARQRPQFRFHLVLTHEARQQTGDLEGLVSAEQLQRVAPDLDRSRVYACGPSGFIETARSLCAARAKGFLAEGFTPPAADSTAPEATTTVAVTLQRSGRTLQVSTGLSLLEALEAQGLNPPSGCRMGICHTCSCTRLAGATAHMQTGECGDEPASAVRLCVSRAQSDVTLDL